MPAPHPYAALLDEIPVTGREVSVLGGTTAYWDYGPADAPVTVVAVHGFRGEHHGLEPVVAHLPGMRIISPDLPGFGDTAPIAGRRHDLSLYAEWLAEFVSRVAPGAVILGHSFGSIVVAAAVAAGLDTPRVILVNPIGAPALEGPRGILTRLAVFYYWAGARLPSGVGTALLRNGAVVRVMSVSMAKTRDPELRRFIHDQHDTYFSRFADRDVLHDAFVASVSHDVREFASRITQPTLLIAAERDDITPIEAERELARLFANAALVEIADVGHLIHYETPAPAAAAIRTFLGLDEPDTR
ncbi:MULTISPECIES: alpha/beta fold hydrolase [unclassified Microbacterium]|uniref:alpha/beta fold hydrolase n=1 Tax=Microbacterium TaxID=33882 RepID=UPI000C3612D5|nr:MULTISPECIES: alpha/beta hydrolase [unclassified Microbacterium]MEC8762036.1 alpha/beta hydrolase [Actinomycetota bacterium]HIE92651.1 alpha/beta hydrolase [Acidobacteriota bacterium]MBU20644.1 alpha/beta hydrolase [Microbacterium sp.]HAJ18102.1 alpha/beta hydrolase [Microbacterium sp.]HAM11733.1 alpha/beta hydrolase [Microbacterium sp.]